MTRQILVLCENDLNRDGNVLRQVLDPRPVRVLPCLGETLDARAARLVQRNAAALASSRPKPVLVVHRDADESTVSERRRQIDAWLSEHDLGRLVHAVVPCIPDPCIERWLCAGARLKVRAEQTIRPCEPWKKCWERAPGPEWRRLEAAVLQLLEHPAPKDFAEFLESVKRIPE